MRYYSRVPIVMLIVGLLASLYTAGRRIAVERAARTVELTVAIEQLRGLTLDLGVRDPACHTARPATLRVGAGRSPGSREGAASGDRQSEQVRQGTRRVHN